jgi:hypothetical protein
MKMSNEQQLFDLRFRKEVIEDIEGSENVERKNASKKAYDLLKDKNKKYVLDKLYHEYEGPVVNEMLNRVSNISIFRKMNDKKAMVYKDGVKRVYMNEQGEKDEEGQEKLDNMIDLLNFNQKMKRTNKFVEAIKNCEAYLLPYLDKPSGLWKFTLNPLAPHYFDILEDDSNFEVKRVMVFSYFTNERLLDGDGVDQIIADDPNDVGEVTNHDGNKRFTWWSDNYHFITDGSGRILPDESPEDLMNPIGEIPSETFAREQDGSYWAEGGEDAVDGCILINLLLTDMYFIAKFQGMGIFYLFGQGIPKHVKIGPSDAIIIDTGKDPEAKNPEIGFATSNPPLADHMEMIEQQLSFLLSSNNLEPSMSSSRVSARNTSGIQDIIAGSENTDSIEDQKETYRDGEKGLFRKAIKFFNFYADRNLLHEDFMEAAGMDPKAEILIEFKDAAVFTSEKDRLDIIERRKELLLDSHYDAMMRDNPDMDLDQAKIKLAEIIKIKKEIEALTMPDMEMEDENGEEKENQGNENPSNEEET